jgi:hypothetical protein
MPDMSDTLPRNRAPYSAIVDRPPQPHRVRYLEEVYDYAKSLGDVVVWTRDEILDWYCAALPDALKEGAAA